MPLPLYQDPPAPSAQAPLTTSFISAGGLIELYEKIGTNFVRRAFVEDVTTGLTLTRNIAGLDELSFSIAHDRFKPASGVGSVSAFLSQLQENWNASRSSMAVTPYAKRQMFHESMYLFYTEKTGLQRRFRIFNLSTEELSALTGVAVDASVILSDFLTQYLAGRNRYSGQLPSMIATRLLDGDQGLGVQNRRFARDAPVRLITAIDLPDLTPAKNLAGVPVAALPYVQELQAVVSDDAALFGGLPHETVPPNGGTMSLSTGYLYHVAYNDADSLGAGTFQSYASEGRVAAPLNISTTSIVLPGEATTYVSRCVYGAMQSTATGTFGFRIQSSGGLRVYFRGQKIYDDMSAGAKDFRWQSNLENSKWYPIVIHHAHTTGTQTLSLKWTPPAGSEVLVPASALSQFMHGGLVLVRFSDLSGVIRFVLCYKRWDGRALILGHPLPASVFSAGVQAGSHWPKAVPAGTLIEQVSFPRDHELARLRYWGTGWTRRPGPRSISQFPVPTSRFSPAITGY